jgi:hypothetical protein
MADGITSSWDSARRASHLFPLEMGRSRVILLRHIFVSNSLTRFDIFLLKPSTLKISRAKDGLMGALCFG